jgi:hypothetical protein
MLQDDRLGDLLEGSERALAIAGGRAAHGAPSYASGARRDTIGCDVDPAGAGSSENPQERSVGGAPGAFTRRIDEVVSREVVRFLCVVPATTELATEWLDER